MHAPTSIWQLANLWQSDAGPASIKFIGGEKMGIDFFSHSSFSVFYECVPPFLTFTGLPFTRQVLVSCHKSNEELLKCTTGTDLCKERTTRPQPSLLSEERTWEENMSKNESK